MPVTRMIIHNRNDLALKVIGLTTKNNNNRIYNKVNTIQRRIRPSFSAATKVGRYAIKPAIRNIAMTPKRMTPLAKPGGE
jgi:hypothetical protein